MSYLNIYDFRKLLISANKCAIGETYYLTGEFWDYGDSREVGVLAAIAKASGTEIERKETYEYPKPLINVPVKFNGKTKAVERGYFRQRKGFEFEMVDGEKVYMYANDKLFKKPYEKN